jgi:adenylate cyclase class 2
MTAPRRNIELKARCPDPSFVRRALELLDARHARTMMQLDTYFPVPQGRLKLREIDSAAAELIWYDRPDTTEFKSSLYHVVPVPDPALLKATLTAANGLRGQVRKTRELWLFHNVRVHLDTVDHLGDFIEFEAVMRDEISDEPSQARLHQLKTALQIHASDIECASYSDLLGL